MPNADSPSHSARPSLLQIADLFLRYSNFTFGGGSATIAVVRAEMSDKRGWLSNENFALCFALARLTPGTNVLAFFTGVGWVLRGAGGAVVALLAATIPCSLIVIVATALFASWQGIAWVQAAIHGAIAGAIAITLCTAWTIVEPQIQAGARLRVALIFAAAFVLYSVFKFSAIEVLIIAALCGALLPQMAAP